MNKHELVNEIRLQRADSAAASARAGALETTIKGETNEIARYERLANDAREQRAKLIAEQRDANDEARFAAEYADRLGALLVNVELGEASEKSISVAVTTARHAAHEAASVVDVDVIDESGYEGNLVPGSDGMTVGMVRGVSPEMANAFVQVMADRDE